MGQKVLSSQVPYRPLYETCSRFLMACEALAFRQYLMGMLSDVSITAMVAVCRTGVYLRAHV